MNFGGKVNILGHNIIVVYNILLVYCSDNGDIQCYNLVMLWCTAVMSLSDNGNILYYDCNGSQLSFKLATMGIYNIIIQIMYGVI